MDTGTVPALLYVAIAIFILVLAVCWIVLPFAIIGTKPLLRELLAEQKRTNQLLSDRMPATRPSTAQPDPQWGR